MSNTVESPAAATVSWAQAIAWRMRRQHLLAPAMPADLAAVVARICGLHAQVMSAAELALWARIEGLDRDALRDALWERRTLVKLWGMRGTLHLLPASELGMWLAGFGSYRDYRVTDPAIVELVDAVGKALHGAMRTRVELAADVERHTGSASLGDLVHGSWGLYLKPASFRGTLCFAPDEGGRRRFTAPATWVPGGVPQVDTHEALAGITRRYLGAFAPAATEDLARWWGVGPTQARRMLGALGDAVVAVDVEEDRCWVLAEHLPELVSASPAAVVRLLPGFDQWVLGASRAAPALLAPAFRGRVYRDQGWISPVLLVDGRMDGVWRSERIGRRLLVEITPFRRLSGRARTQAEAEAVRLAEFLDGALDLRWLG